MSCPVTVSELAPATQIWVKRYVWSWVPVPTTDDSCPPPLVPQAVCTFELADKVLPAIKDWPRWKYDNAVQLPVDEYWRVTWSPQVTCPASNQCGPQVQWNPIWTKIETPRAWRWISSACDHSCSEH